jgi:prepilin signal peptidase PulO-like enzyme (type II secretory pathway)
MRRALTTAMVLAGAALMVLGYALSAPWGAESVANSNPRVPFAPAIFVLGVVVVFSSAIVYELLPRRFD